MIRFYLETVNSILMVLIWVSQVPRVTYQDIHNDLRNWLNSTPPEETGRSRYLRQFVADRLVEEVRDSQKGAVPGQDAIIDQILEQTRQAEGGSSRAGDLIDTIAKILQLPYTTNRLAPKILKTLRNAILLPEEIGGLINRLNKGELHCGMCGKEFSRGEMLTLVNDPQNLLSCHKCNRPSCVAADCCDTTIVLDRKLRNYHEKQVLCDQHGLTNKAQQQIDQPIYRVREIIQRSRLDGDDVVLDEGAPF